MKISANEISTKFRRLKAQNRPYESTGHLSSKFSLRQPHGQEMRRRGDPNWASGQLRFRSAIVWEPTGWDKFLASIDRTGADMPTLLADGRVQAWAQRYYLKLFIPEAIVLALGLAGGA